MTQLLVWLTNRVAISDEEGQTGVEYALVIAAVAIAIVFILKTGAATTLFDAFWTRVSSALGA